MQSHRFPHAICWLLCMLPSLPVMAAECTANSGTHSVALLELYTSEGCSSCPPADQWLSKIATQGFSTGRVIPLGLHVDYWDYIGWQDKFAKPVFSVRQREQAGLSGSSFVYTPQVMLNGKDFRSWSSAARWSDAVEAINHSSSRATINLVLDWSASVLKVSATAQASQQETPVLYVAVYENDLTTAVKAGENNGTVLHHDYVVREWLGPYPMDGKLAAPWQQKIPLHAEWKIKNMGAVAFVQNRANGEVLQAVALKSCA